MPWVLVPFFVTIGVMVNGLVVGLYPIVLSSDSLGLCRTSAFFSLPEKELLVHVINKQSCDKDLMLFFRKQVLVCTSRNICFKTKHIPGITREISS